MKKQKYYLAAGILACSAISGLAMPLANTFALDPGAYTKDATVGEVDETIYSVDIVWGDMIFDWKYNEQKNDFEFKAHWNCVGGYVWTGSSVGDYYTDDACSVKYTENIEGTSGLYYKDARTNVSVIDNSVNGAVTASVSFTPEDRYSWVVGRFTDDVAVDMDAEVVTYGEDIVDGVLPRMTDSKNRSASLHLTKDPSAVVSAESVSASDKIGTITLTISPDTTPINNQ